MTVEFEKIEPRYLGDGVYACFDGYQIWLGLAPLDRQVALEPSVMDALIEFADHINERVRDYHQQLLKEGPERD